MIKQHILCVVFSSKLVVGKDEQNQRVNSIYKLEVGGCCEQKMLLANNVVLGFNVLEKKKTDLVKETISLNFIFKYFHFKTSFILA